MTRWWVVFEPIRHGPSWAHWLLTTFLRPPHHCWAFKQAEGGIIVVQRVPAVTDVDYAPGVDAAKWADLLRERGYAVEELVTDPTRHRWSPGLATCVTTIRQVAGWSARWQSSRGLLRQIRRHMGGAAKPKKPTAGERAAAAISAEKGSADYLAIQDSRALGRKARKRPSVFGGNELGVGASRLGVS